MTESSFGELLSGLVGDLNRLVRQELRLAQSELAEKLRQAEVGFYLLMAGLLAALATLLFALLAAVLALSLVMPAWGASLTVALVMAVLAVLLVRQGRASLQPRNLIPTLTLHAAGDDTQERAARR